MLDKIGYFFFFFLFFVIFFKKILSWFDQTVEKLKRSGEVTETNGSMQSVKKERKS